MSTITSSTPSVEKSRPLSVPNAAPIPAEQRIAIRDIPWDLYDRLSDAIGDGQNVHLAYDGKDLEIMVIGPTHEDAKEWLQLFVKAVAFELRIRCRAGQTTWKRPEMLARHRGRSLLFLRSEKLAVIADARTRQSNDIADLSESRPGRSRSISPLPRLTGRASIVRSMLTRVWRFDGSSLVIEQLNRDGTYVTTESSSFLPVRADEVVRWVVEEDCNDEIVWETATSGVGPYRTGTSNEIIGYLAL